MSSLDIDLPDPQGDWLHADEVHSLYSQTEVWVDKQGAQHRLVDMDTRYLRNVVRFLDRGVMAGHLWFASWNYPIPRLNGDMAQFHAEQDHARATDECVTWSTRPNEAPLYRAMHLELATRRRGNA